MPPPRRRPGRPCVSSTVLLRIEFTAPDSLQPASELLPHFSTLASSAQASYPSLPRKRESSLISLRILSQTRSLCSSAFGAQKRVGGAVSLCCTFPEVAFGGRYPLSLPCGARTFLTVGLSAVPRGCPARLQGYFSPGFRKCQSFFREKNIVFLQKACYNKKSDKKTRLSGAADNDKGRILP